MTGQSSKLKSLNTGNPEDFRKHLQEVNEMLRLTGGGVNEEKIEEIIHMHCDEGVSLEDCLKRIT